MRWLLAIVAWALTLPQAAQAEWLEASSGNFVVYADDSERDIRKFTGQLELYHQALEGMTGLDLPEPSPSNRLTVFVVRNEREVQRLYGEDARYVGGFYVPRAGASMAVVSRIKLKRNEPDQSMIVLLHEYAHHFLIANSALPMPRWVSEGAAEFFASAEFSDSGGIKVGMPAYHRAGELLHARDVKVRQLLDPASYQDGVQTGFDSFYGKSWVLYHYLSMVPERRGQLQQYLGLMAQGTSSLEAGAQVFGDFDALERALDKYIRDKILTAVFAPGQLPVGPVAVRRLSAGEAAMMPVRIRSRRGVDAEQAAALVPEARRIAQGFPQDAAVLAALAEVEFDAGNDAAAIAAADAALALDPARVNAYVQKGFALFRQAPAADDIEAAYEAAIEPFLALNAIENDHPLPLMYYYRSFAERGLRPPEEAMHGLERAAELAPFDLGLRMNVATSQIMTGDLARARANLLPLAYHPHGSDMAEAARQVVAQIDAGTTEPQVLMATFQRAPQIP